jgi:hypothetical protein
MWLTIHPKNHMSGFGVYQDLTGLICFVQDCLRFADRLRFCVTLPQCTMSNHSSRRS